MDEIKRRLELSRKKIGEAHKEFERIDEVVAQEPVLDEKVKQFENLGIANKLKNAQLLEQEKDIEARIAGQLRPFYNGRTAIRKFLIYYFCNETTLINYRIRHQ